MWSKKQRVQHEVIMSKYFAAGGRKKENNNNRLTRSADRKQQTWIKVWLQTAALKTGDLPPCVWLGNMAVYLSDKEPTKSISKDGGKTQEVTGQTLRLYNETSSAVWAKPQANTNSQWRLNELTNQICCPTFWQVANSNWTLNFCYHRNLSVHLRASVGLLTEPEPATTGDTSQSR